MKKLVTPILALAIVLAVSASALAGNGNGKGRGNGNVNAVAPGDATSNGATQWPGVALPVAEGGTATAKVRAVQNRLWLQINVVAKGLVPGGTYTAAVHRNSDGTGCASTTNPVLDPPTFAALVADEEGNGQTRAKVRRGTVQLFPLTDYYVAIADAAGMTVACGAMTQRTR